AVGLLCLPASFDQRRLGRLALRRAERRLALGQLVQLLAADCRTRGGLCGKAGGDQHVGEPEQRGPGHEEQRGVHEREPGPDLLRPQPAKRTHVHGSRYPLPVTVSIGSGSPSLPRSRPIVTVTVRVNGSAFSSHTRSSSSSALTTPPSATRSSS